MEEHIYVLECVKDKWYVGTTNDVDRRLEQHKTGAGSEWTKKYPMVALHKTWKSKGEHDENNTTKDYMHKYGLNNVRGGSYAFTRDLNVDEKKFIDNEMKSAKNKCYKCGGNGHYANKCQSKNKDMSAHTSKNTATKNIAMLEQLTIDHDSATRAQHTIKDIMDISSAETGYIPYMLCTNQNSQETTSTNEVYNYPTRLPEPKGMANKKIVMLAPNIYAIVDENGTTMSDGDIRIQNALANMLMGRAFDTMTAMIGRMYADVFEESGKKEGTRTILYHYPFTRDPSGIVNGIHKFWPEVYDQINSKTPEPEKSTRCKHSPRSILTASVPIDPIKYKSTHTGDQYIMGYADVVVACDEIVKEVFFIRHNFETSEADLFMRDVLRVNDVKTVIIDASLIVNSYTGADQTIDKDNVDDTRRIERYYPFQFVEFLTYLSLDENVPYVDELIDISNKSTNISGRIKMIPMSVIYERYALWSEKNSGAKPKYENARQNSNGMLACVIGIDMMYFAESELGSKHNQTYNERWMAKYNLPSETDWMKVDMDRLLMVARNGKMCNGLISLLLPK